MNTELHITQAKQVEANKNVYHRPQLLIYGNVRELTQGTGSMNPNSDGGTGMNNKT